MIYDTLNHRKQYQSVHPGVAAALDALADTDWSAVPDGRYELDGDNVFINVMRYDTKADNPTPERHEKYIDIFYLLEGEEEVAVCRWRSWARWWRPGPRGTSGSQGHRGPAAPGGRAVPGPVLGGRPRPSIGPNGPAPARKCVAKVRV